MQSFQVFPYIPEPLSFLVKLARNLWWCWHIDSIELFRRIDPHLWKKSGRNPIVFSTIVSQRRLEDVADDQSYIAHLRRVEERFLKETQPLHAPADSFYRPEERIAYFSMEFGIHESLPLFAGGLGVLAGDHLKAASDLDIPLVGVGLLYRQGYFNQYLDHNGVQQEAYPDTDLSYLPTVKAKNSSGEEVVVSVFGPDGEIRAAVWRIMVGRIPLYLLDTNLPENPPHLREITARLYTGDLRQRLAQEIVLGIGGIRALDALGIEPSVCHLNEGHSAFSGVERIARTMRVHDVDLATAFEIVPRSSIFTTHTPVAAGHDEFAPDLVRPYLQPLEEQLGAGVEEIISWGQPMGSGAESPLSMFVLGLRMSQYHNGVSELHGKVARRMWASIWPGWPEEEVPISHVTNGVHTPSWLSVENSLLFDRYIGPDWYLSCWDNEKIGRIDQIYDEELWRAHEMQRSRLVRICREILVRQYSRRNAPTATIRAAETVLDPEVFTIGFARRFATYKRATLLMRDPDRLERMINSEDRPIQIIFAGKAHPRDHEGKDLIRRIVEFAQRPSVRHRVVFLENYDINIARHLVQGVDIWLNTPRRPMEASGTSGMKAAVNGTLNVSILDGWWVEGYTNRTGWAIGRGEEYMDAEYQDIVDCQALYNLLENDVIPCFYDRKNGGMPSRWIRMMKESIKMGMADFCAHRMVTEYESHYYREAVKQIRSLISNDRHEAKQMVERRRRLLALWHEIRIGQPTRKLQGPFQVGESFDIYSEIHLGQIEPDEVDVELYYGQSKGIDTVTDSKCVEMTVLENQPGGKYVYVCNITCEAAGRYGFTVRVTPKGDDQIKFTRGLITWGN